MFNFSWGKEYRERVYSYYKIVISDLYLAYGTTAPQLIAPRRSWWAVAHRHSASWRIIVVTKSYILHAGT